MVLQVASTFLKHISHEQHPARAQSRPLDTQRGGCGDRTSCLRIGTTTMGAHSPEQAPPPPSDRQVPYRWWPGHVGEYSDLGHSLSPVTCRTPSGICHG